MAQPPATCLWIIQGLILFVISGTLSASSVTPADRATTPTTLLAFRLPMEITNRVFNESLKNRDSDDYKKMFKEVEQLLDDAFVSMGSYEGIREMDFSAHKITAINQSSTRSSADGGGSGDSVPGWAIALLVLAAVILLLLIIMFIMMVVHWCCKISEKNLSEDPSQNLVGEPANDNNAQDINDPPKNKTGVYVVNP
ncbi:hypothetical protein DPEC_G00203000 [Dallia pectoralis]|uniref:Uncharacterized protein n=1 Tax=Dallia pectoralis TaxID=75939 RepID=A0ACC2G9Q9_DALPE|nr:hypothetical protein DPEC_G00203000 [Dallia pectoralis]